MPIRKFTRSQAPNAATIGPTKPLLNSPVGLSLSQWLAKAGVASRKQSGVLVKNGNVTVNGQTVTQGGYKIQEGDELRFKGKELALQQEAVFALLNKPKGVAVDYVLPEAPPGPPPSTGDLPTISQLLRGTDLEGLRALPTGHLAPADTGLVLLTNEVAAAQRLTRPNKPAIVVYEAHFAEGLRPAQIETLSQIGEANGQSVVIDWARPARTNDDTKVALRTRNYTYATLQAIFAAAGLTPNRLDRTYLAGLTKKGLPRGFFRGLDEEEERMVRYFS